MEVLIFTFSSGLIAAFNPCGILMFPAYVGYQLKSINQIDSQKPVVFALFIKALSLGIFTSLGFVVLFGFMGLLLGLFGSLIRAWVPLMGLIIGVLLIVIGVFLLGFRAKINILFLSIIFLFNNQIASAMLFENHSEYIIVLGIIVSLDSFSAIPLARLRAKEKAVKFSIIQISSILLNIILNLIFFLVLFDSHVESLLESFPNEYPSILSPF